MCFAAAVDVALASFSSIYWLFGMNVVKWQKFIFDSSGEETTTTTTKSKSYTANAKQCFGFFFDH